MPANDGTADGWYMLLTDKSGHCHAEWHRLRYPVGQTFDEMIEAGLKSGYAEAITSGLWPSEDVLLAREKDQRGQALQPSPMSF